MPREEPAQVMRAVGRRVAELRRAKGLTQALLSERLEVTTQYVARIEAGGVNLSLRALVEIASALETPVASLFEQPASLNAEPRGRPRRSSQPGPGPRPRVKRPP